MSPAEIIISVNCFTSLLKLLNKHCLQASTSLHNMHTQSPIAKMHLCTICSCYLNIWAQLIISITMWSKHRIQDWKYSLTGFETQWLERLSRKDSLNSVIHALKSISMAPSVFLVIYLFLKQPYACMAGYTTLLCSLNGLQLTCWASLPSMQKKLYKWWVLVCLPSLIKQDISYILQQ